MRFPQHGLRLRVSAAQVWALFGFCAPSSSRRPRGPTRTHRPGGRRARDALQVFRAAVGLAALSGIHPVRLVVDALRAADGVPDPGMAISLAATAALFLFRGRMSAQIEGPRAWVREPARKGRRRRAFPGTAARLTSAILVHYDAEPTGRALDSLRAATGLPLEIVWSTTAASTRSTRGGSPARRRSSSRRQQPHGYGPACNLAAASLGDFLLFATTTWSCVRARSRPTFRGPRQVSRRRSRGSQVP